MVWVSNLLLEMTPRGIEPGAIWKPKLDSTVTHFEYDTLVMHHLEYWNVEDSDNKLCAAAVEL